MNLQSCLISEGKNRREPFGQPSPKYAQGIDYRIPYLELPVRKGSVKGGKRQWKQLLAS
ncbi:hypothetical protein GCM10011571_25750 [Marinithermofilum abyssi]|uniref:Uncharacterized protein n=1 Tax=Marinithermofilum abyssi TaxID=1571185 RepID=A0A8J2VE58_9BACL|nr:hypothetical protein GCM10011571_25750 [Marinithermofilum abyssi]